MSEPAELSRDRLDRLIRRLRHDKARPGAPAAGRPAPAPARPEEPPPLSSGQERLWFLERLQPGPAYNFPAALSLSGALDVPALATSLAEIARRHEPLRTVFAEAGGRPRLVVRDACAAAALPHLAVVDLGALPATVCEEAALALAASEGARPFDLAAAPPLRTTLVRLAEREHLLLLTLHHIASDGWSMGVLSAELAALYPAFAAGRPSPLPPLPLSYAGWARRERERLADGALAPLLAWWRERLAGAPERLDLPADRPRPPVRSARGGHRPVALGRGLREGVESLARRCRTTPFAVLLAAWGAVLLRWSGEEDLPVGSPLARRSMPGAERLIGFLVDTVVLRLGLGEDPSFLAAVERVWETAQAAWAHGDLPFEKLVEEVAPGRGLSHAPVAQVFFAYQNIPAPPLVLPGLAVQKVEIERESAKFDLMLELAETAAGGLAGQVEWSRDLFFEATAARLAGWFETLLAGAVAAPGRPLSQLTLLAEAERHQLLAEWGPGPPRGVTEIEAGERSVHELFAEQVATRPGAVALEWRGGRMSYAELAAAAGRLAARLSAAGAGPEARVALCLPRSPEFVVAALATLEAGAAYVPLDPGYPAERLAFLLEDSGSTVLVTEEALLTALPDPLPARIARVVLLDAGDLDSSAHVEDLTGFPDCLSKNSDPPPSVRPVIPSALERSPDRLAYVMYTSGSTGTPKGVAVAHRGIVRLVRGGGFADLSPGQTFLLLAPVSFDASTLEIWGPLANGGRLVVFPAGEPLDRLGDALREHGVTTLWLTAGLFHQMMDGDLASLGSLGQLLSGGEAISPPHVRRALAALPGCRLTNAYGPTENTTFTCCQSMATPEEVHDPVAIGRPIGGTSIFLLDRWGEPAAIGAPGELWTGGEGLARGYLGRPDLTAERFIPDPFGEGGALGARDCPGGALGARLYRTGDLCRWLPDGRIEFLGRIDRQVKVRGFRIELAEIEAALAAHPALAGCAVAALPDPSGSGKRLLAGIVVRNGSAPPAAAELRRFLGGKLPEHMLPGRFLPLESLPLTLNGKVDRRTLERQLARLDAETGAEGATGTSAAAVPRGQVEEMLAGIWADLLGRERVGADEDFFDLGGHSLLATQLVSRVREAAGVDLPLADMFEAPTVAGLARRLEQALRRRSMAAGPAPGGIPDLAGPAPGGIPDLAEPPPGGVPDLFAPPPIRPAPRQEQMPLSFPQERLWFLDQLDPGNPVYNVPLAVRARGPLSVPVLAAALSGVVARHEALRTVFPEQDGRAVQAVLPILPTPPISALPLVDLSALFAERREEVALAVAEEEGARSFDLATGPVLRALVLRLDAAEHVLALTVHHIASDGWSTGVLLADLAALYGAFAAGRSSPLVPLPVQYGDFAAWQRAWIAGEVRERQLAYWRERLAGLPALELPTDRPRPPARRLRGASRPVRLGADLSAAAGRFARRAGATPFMVLLTAFAGLLARWSGQDDFAVAAPVANRRRPELEGLIGFFANTLVLRADLTGSLAGQEALARVRRTCLGAYAHQDLPFDRLVEELAPARDLSRTPLVQAMLAFQTAPVGPLALPGLVLEPLEVPSRSARFDLTLSLVPGLGGAEGIMGLAGILEYDRDLFDGATAGRLESQLGVLLGALCAEPERRLWELPMLSAPEAHQLRVEWTATSTAYPAGRCTQELFEEQADRVPDAVALTVSGEVEEHLTYAGLERAANRLAWALKDAGVGPEARVGVCLERSVSYAVAILAVLKAGGVYLPLDPAYPAERLAYLLADSGAAVLISEERLLGCLPEPLPENVRRVIRLDADRAELRGASASRPAPGSVPENLAYVMYTSGSTGRPKGVAVAHRGIVRLVRETDFASFDAGEVFLMLTPLSFDVSTFEIWGALANGGRLAVLPGRGVMLDELGEAIRRHGVTTLWLSAGLFHQMVELDLPALSPLRQLVAGGDALSAPHARRALGGLPHGRLIDGYGPTENTTFTACSTMERPEDVGVSVAIGRPIANTTVYLVSREGEPVPVGVPGELWTGGDGVARGYLGRPDLTAERFVPDNVALGARDCSGGALGARNCSGGALGARLYRTGDLCRWRPDGKIEYLGRLDNQVKVRGFRIELGEIEAVLASHSAVRECAVAALADPAGGGKRLAAYLVAGGPAPDPADLPADLTAELRRHLAGRLPDYMVPAFFVFLPALPLSPNGKVDRRALPAPNERPNERRGMTAAYVPPRIPVEELLVGIWEHLLGVERIGVEDGFFDLGGHSLLATQLVSRVREAAGVDLPLADLFEAPTVAGLAERVERALRRRGAARELTREGMKDLDLFAPPPIRPAPRQEQMPLSFPQERLWFLDQLDPGNPVYNIPLAVRARGPLSVPVLAAALSGVVARHEALRTVFSEQDGRAAQSVRPILPILPISALPLVDLSALPTQRREEVALALVEEEGTRSFDLTTGPVLRALVLRLDAAEHVLAVTVHHIAADGWSTGVLLADLAALYGAFAAGRPSPLAPLPVQYGDFAAWQRAWIAGEVRERQLAYWRERLAGLPALELPNDRPRPPARRLKGASRPVRLDAELAAAAGRLAHRAGATPFMVLLTAFAGLLARWSAQEDFAVAAPVANRRRPELEGLIGFFANTLVMRADLAGSPAGLEALARVRRTCLGAYAYQDFPFDSLVEDLAPARDLARTPLVQVALAFQTAPVGPLALPGLALEPLEVPSRSARFDLTLSLVPGAAGHDIPGMIEYDRDLFDGATAGRLASQLGVLLGALSTAPERRLWEMPLLSAPEAHQLQIEWTATSNAHPSSRCVQELFEEQADRAPDAVALVVSGQEGEHLTYAGLERRANRLAWVLRRAGVGPETRVGVCLERSASYAVAILAVVKAGGAYVPLDPAYPAERLAYLLADSGAAVLLGEEGLLGGLPAPLPGNVRRVILLDGFREDGMELRAASASRPERPAVAGGPEDLAYVMYTSGSTGRPKGVAVPHRGIVRLVKEPGFASFGAGEAFLMLAPLAFDASTFEIWGALANGGRLAVLPGRGIALEELGEAIRRHGVTTLWLSAGLFHQLVELDLAALSPLSQLVAGGDVLSAPHVRRVLGGLRHGRLIDGYGPTENTTFTACNTMANPEEVGAAVSIGRPIANTTVHLVSRQGEPVPVGVPGELWTGGEGLARGYLGRPELTAERFVPHEGGARDCPGGALGARLYRTGDLCRWRPDGKIEYLGRLDQQVKVRGFRIELGEIEAVLAAHPAVRECAVAALADPAGGGKRLAAYLVAGGPAPDPADLPADLTAELRRHLAGRLPDYMVPAFFVFLPALPLSPNGKVDRRALPTPDERGGTAAAYVPPRTAVEERLAGIWQEMLGIERAGVEDNFFELGGHSLLATRLMSRVREAFAVELPLRRLFENPTVAGLAAEIIEAGRAARPEASLPPVLPGTAPAAAPLSYAQERLWILERIEPGTAAYNVPVALDFLGGLLPAVLARSLDEVVRRQGALRTWFGSEEGRPFQCVDPSAAVPLPVVDLAGISMDVSMDAGAREAGRLAAEEAATPFDLTRAPLLRARLLRLGPDRWRLVLDAHHIAVDGWSMGVMVGELAALYTAFSRGEPSPLRPLPVQYVDYAAWERRWRGAEALAGQLDYWRQQLAGLPALELPADRPRRAVRTFSGARRSLALPGELSDRLRALGRRHGATLFMTLLAGFAVVLERLAGEDDLAVGTPVAGRLRGEVEGLVGMFLNTLVLRLDLADDPAFEDLLARVRETALAAYAHQEVPFEMLLDALQPERDLSRTPLFQVFFNLLSFPLPDVALPGISLAEAAAPEPPSKFDLTAYVRERGERIGVELVFNADLFDGVRGEEILAQLAAVLGQAAAEPAVRIGDLSLSTARALAVLPDPRAELDAAWHGAVHELFSRQAAADPGRPAVVDRDGSWTYGRVEAESNRLAGRLVAAGLRPGEPVAIYAHRSAALAWTVFGVLKAGGAFALLDPAYPPARQVEMLRLARPGAWVQLDAAGAPDPELASYVAAAFPAGRRIVLPPGGLSGGDPSQPPPVAVGPDDVAYVAFTSGSTGMPKGILGRHGPLSHFLPWMTEFYGLGAEDRFSLLSALAHDPLQRDLFTPLCLGARLCVPDPAEMMAPGRLAAWMRREGVTVANLTPAMAQVLTEQVAGQPAGSAPAEPTLPALRYVFLVGDALTRWIVARLRLLAPQVTCVNHYGSTETQRAVGFHPIPPGEGEGEESREVLPLGRGIPDVQLLVLSRGRERLAGIGEVGEIAMRSPHLAAGYLGAEGETGERFRANPFTGAPGDRIYRTGDLGRYLPNGEVAFAGRADQQVKVRGFRIELGEVEGRLSRLPGVREAVVLAREEAPGDRRLAAYVVPLPAGAAGSPEAAATVAELRRRLAAELPAYMLPASFVLLERMPLTANGKIDRRALLRLAAGREVQVSYKAPETDDEKRIAAILMDVLRIERVGVDDNFFELGGNSLLLVEVHSRLQQAFGREIPVVDLFGNPTVSALARQLAREASADGPGETAAPPAPAEDRSEKLLEGRNRLLRRRLDQRRST